MTNDADERRRARMSDRRMRAPLIRFAGFAGDWEERKLGDVSEKVTEKNKNNIYTETLTNSAEFGIINQRDFFDKDISNEKNLNGYYVVRPDDFVYNPRISNFAPVGPIKRNKLGRTGVMSPLYYVFRTHNVDVTYLEKYFSSDGWQIFMKLNGDSGARADRFAIKDSVFREMPIPIPSIKEQTKIGVFFDNLDNLITLQQRQLDKLAIVKKTMLEKMFPKDGSNVPEIRFVGFTGAWEERKLGELGTLKNGMNFSKEAMGIGFPFVNLQNIFGKNIIDIANLGMAEANQKQLKDYNLLEGDVLFVRSSVKLEGVGEAAIISETLVNTTYSGFIIRFRDEYGMEKNFKRYVFSTRAIRKQIIAQATDSANKNISQPVLSNLDISLPSYEEQKQIGTFFSTLDNLLTLHQRELNGLKTLKKSMLQQLFV